MEVSDRKGTQGCGSAGRGGERGREFPDAGRAKGHGRSPDSRFGGCVPLPRRCRLVGEADACISLLRGAARWSGSQR